MKIKRGLIILIAVTLFSSTFVNSQQLRIGVDGGVANLAGSNLSEFNWGFGVGGHLLFYIDDNILLGIRGAYNRWTPDKGDFSSSVGDIFSSDVKGSAWVVEIIPTLRLTTNYPMSFVNFFAQAGAGVYILSNRVTVTGTSVVDEAPVEEVFGKGTRGRFGLQAGGGFSFGNPRVVSVDAFSLYNLIFAGNSSAVQYFTINLGLSFSI
jgi:hypothetical protein